MNGEETPDDAAQRTASASIGSASARRRRISSAKAKAELEEDLEELTVKFNSFKFMVCVIAVILFDAVVFQSLDSWSAPLSILAVEMVLVFTLARYFEIPEAVQFTYRLLDAAIKKDKDPGASEG